MAGVGMPKSVLMKLRSAHRTQWRGLAVLVCGLAAALAIAGCGTPAVIKPSATPLPGLQRDIHAAQNVVAKTEREAQSDAASTPSS
jgi:hypothetical protein